MFTKSWLVAHKRKVIFGQPNQLQPWFEWLLKIKFANFYNKYDLNWINSHYRNGGASSMWKNYPHKFSFPSITHIIIAYNSNWNFLFYTSNRRRHSNESKMLGYIRWGKIQRNGMLSHQRCTPCICYFLIKRS